jgi:hypothetical protein
VRNPSDRGQQRDRILGGSAAGQAEVSDGVVVSGSRLEDVIRENIGTYKPIFVSGNLLFSPLVAPIRQALYFKDPISQLSAIEPNTFLGPASPDTPGFI